MAEQLDQRFPRSEENLLSSELFVEDNGKANISQNLPVFKDKQGIRIESSVRYSALYLLR